MIAGLAGRLTARNGDRILVTTAGGVTYEIHVPLGVLERLPAEGEDLTLHTALVVREDAWALFGFDRDPERVLFQRLLGASGVGPRVALAMLSALGGNRLVRVLREADLGTLCTIPGIGKKKAERIVLELKDKLGDLGGVDRDTPPPAGDQAIQALVNLGYPTGDAERAVRAALAGDGAAAPAELIRRALKILSGGA